MRVIIAPAARADLRSIMRYLAQRDPDLAETYNRRFREATRTMAERPSTFSRRDELVRGLRSVQVHPYLIFFMVTDGAILVVRVLHSARNIPRLFNA